MTYTHQCGGDLGLKVNGRVVAMYFVTGAGRYNVYDISAGGEPYYCLDQAEALNCMLMIAASCAS